MTAGTDETTGTPENPSRDSSKGHPRVSSFLVTRAPGTPLASSLGRKLVEHLGLDPGQVVGALRVAVAEVPVGYHELIEAEVRVPAELVHQLLRGTAQEGAAR